jgi:hypothetical protein
MTNTLAYYSVATMTGNKFYEIGNSFFAQVVSRKAIGVFYLYCLAKKICLFMSILIFSEMFSKITIVASIRECFKKLKFEFKYLKFVMNCLN